MTDQAIPELTVRYEIEAVPDDIPIRGNAMESGDDDADRVYEDKLIERLERGDVWAWALVSVRAVLVDEDGPDLIEGDPDYLGGCVYEDEAGFKADGYYEEMQEQALDNLKQACKEHMNRAGAIGAYVRDVLEMKREARERQQ